MGDSAVAAVRPLPLEDDISAGFWAAARERRLDIQYCSSCFRDMVPLIVGVVELEEQPRLFITTNILGATVEQLRLGAPVEVMFEEVADVVLPQFRLVGE
jgi:uncharacterized OB-fold protein